MLLPVNERNGNFQEHYKWRTYKTSPRQNVSSTKSLHTKRLYTQRLLNETSPVTKRLRNKTSPRLFCVRVLINCRKNNF
jgi:hypothetical protein